MTGTQERIDALAKRLEGGFIKIGQAMEEGQRVGDWEKLWVDLLREYESISDQLEAHGACSKHAGGMVAQSAMNLGIREVRDVA